MPLSSFRENACDMAPKKRMRLTLPTPANGIYAIGDIHGCLDLLKKMEDKIQTECAGRPGDTLILYLGDLVDRGPDSKGVIDHYMSPLPDNLQRISLCGNHDQLFFEFLLQPSLDSNWLGFGGQETLLSYGLDMNDILAGSISEAEFAALLNKTIPQTHRTFLRELPSALSTDEAHFVHAGMRIDLPMAEQTDEDLMWIREDFLVDRQASDRLIVHGHSPAPSPRLGPGRIGVDTKAVGGGPLTAVHVHGGHHRFLSVTREDQTETV